eukprot:14974121-Alexandrium_andersonii.AAC.1
MGCGSLPGPRCVKGVWRCSAFGGGFSPCHLGRVKDAKRCAEGGSKDNDGRNDPEEVALRRSEEPPPPPLGGRGRPTSCFSP